MHHRSARRLAVAVGAAALSLAVGLGAAGAATTWDLPLAWPDGNFHTKNARQFAERVEQATGGAVTINLHPGGSLGYKGPEMLKALRDGLVPIGDYVLNQQVGEMPYLGLEALPFICANLEEFKALHEIWDPRVKAAVEKEWNQKILYIVPWPRQYVYTKSEVKKLDDLQGIKIRTYNRTTTDLFNALGMTAVLLPWGEVVPSLAAGTINSVTTSASSGVDGKFWEFLGYMYPTTHVWNSNAVAVNLDAWNAISPEHRKAIEAVAAELEPQFWDVSRSEDAEKTKILTDNGIVVGTVTPEMRAGMLKRTEPMVAEFVTEVGRDSQEVLDAYFAKVGR